jgi:hypothetical protein
MSDRPSTLPQHSDRRARGIGAFDEALELLKVFATEFVRRAMSRQLRAARHGIARGLSQAPRADALHRP